MACFIVPAIEAVAVTATSKITGSKKLKNLSGFLWGGSALLAFEHLWHGEITPWAPFLTAAGSTEDITVMLHEMSTVGVAMAVVVTAVWGAAMLVTDKLASKHHPEAELSEVES